MSFIRLSDDYNDHPKFDNLSDGAFRLWHQAMGFCRKYQTDGLIPVASIRKFKAYSPKRVRQLLTPWKPGAQALWREIEGFGVGVHDYLEWNLSKEEENEDKDAAKLRMRRLRGAHGDAAKPSRRNGDEPERPITEPPPSIEIDQPHTTMTHDSPNKTGACTDSVRANSDRTCDRTNAIVPGREGKDRIGISDPEKERDDYPPGADAVLSAYRGHWKRTYGYECSLIPSSIETVKLDQQLVKYSVPQLTAALAAFFATTEVYVLKAKHPLPLFLRDPMRFVAKEVAAPKVSREDEAAAVLAIVKRRDAGDFS